MIEKYFDSPTVTLKGDLATYTYTLDEMSDYETWFAEEKPSPNSMSDREITFYRYKNG